MRILFLNLAHRGLGKPNLRTTSSGKGQTFPLCNWQDSLALFALRVKIARRVYKIGIARIYVIKIFLAFALARSTGHGRGKL